MDRLAGHVMLAVYFPHLCNIQLDKVAKIYPCQIAVVVFIQQLPPCLYSFHVRHLGSYGIDKGTQSY